jgi:hypothetical protein
VLECITVAPCWQADGRIGSQVHMLFYLDQTNVIFIVGRYSIFAMIYKLLNRKNFPGEKYTAV